MKDVTGIDHQARQSALNQCNAMLNNAHSAFSRAAACPQKAEDSDMANRYSMCSVEVKRLREALDKCFGKDHRFLDSDPDEAGDESDATAAARALMNGKPIAMSTLIDSLKSPAGVLLSKVAHRSGDEPNEATKEVMAMMQPKAGGAAA